MSLQTGTQLGNVDEAIIDPHQLRVLAYYVDGPLLDERPSIIRIEDIREIGEVGFIIDSSDDITAPEDIVRLQEIIDLGFELTGLKVIDERKHNLGHVLDYNIDAASFEIRQIRVKPPITKILGLSELMIHRDQIVKITNDKIIVKSTSNEERVKAENQPRVYTNPFRGASQQPEASSSETQR